MEITTIQLNKEEQERIKTALNFHCVEYYHKKIKEAKDKFEKDWYEHEWQETTKLFCKFVELEH